MVYIICLRLPPNPNIKAKAKEARELKQRQGARRGEPEVCVWNRAWRCIWNKNMDESILEKQKKRKCLLRARGRFVDGYLRWNCSESRKEDLRYKGNNFHATDAAAPCLSFPPVSRGRAFTNPHLSRGEGGIIPVSVVGPRVLEILASLRWNEDRQNHGYVPCLDSHLSLVLGAHSSAIAFPGRPGLTRNSFCPFRLTPSWVPQFTASRKQILFARGWGADATRLVYLSASTPAAVPQLGPDAQSPWEPLPGGSPHQTFHRKLARVTCSLGSWSRVLDVEGLKKNQCSPKRQIFLETFGCTNQRAFP